MEFHFSEKCQKKHHIEVQLEPPGRRARRECEALFLQNENLKKIPLAIQTFANLFSIVH